jgi:hypothetical protein
VHTPGLVFFISRCAFVNIVLQKYTVLDWTCLLTNNSCLQICYFFLNVAEKANSLRNYKVPRGLKVDSNEKGGGPVRCRMFGSGIRPWRSGFIRHLNMTFSLKKLISVSAL